MLARALPAAAIFLASAVVDVLAGASSSSSMWAELKDHCDSGLCTTAQGSKLRAQQNSTDCHGRMLAYEYGLSILPARSPQLEVFDALQLAAIAVGETVILMHPLSL